jgi:hypothetical protein
LRPFGTVEAIEQGKLTAEVLPKCERCLTPRRSL